MMKKIELGFIALFAANLLATVIFASVFNMPQISLALILAGFPIAGIIAIVASLAVREEEEEKTVLA